MARSIHKDKSEIMLWEAVSSERHIENTVYAISSSRPLKQSEQYIRRRKARRRRAYFCRALAFIILISIIVFIILLAGFIYSLVHNGRIKDHMRQTVWNLISQDAYKEGVEKPEIFVELLNVNEYSRPGTKIDDVKNIFVHYTANPKTSAAQNRSYFANLEQTHERSASAHFIIGYEGEIIQCIPLDEQAYAVKTRNNDSISIECCYLEEDGEFTKETYESLVHMLAWMVQEYNLECTDIMRHYDCGGKKCPLYYVEHEDAWKNLLEDVAAYSAEE
ncbi:MAG: peptidoglycan recognition protein family protein [Clostridiales bacterium]|nr:peptidoglycan recognition protein family protein [Clostridiales bacterium]